MKNPLEYTLGEIEVLIKLRLLENVELPWLQIRHELEQYHRDCHNYQVQAEVKMILEKEQPVQKRVASVDASLFDACVLVSEDLISEQPQPNN